MHVDPRRRRRSADGRVERQVADRLQHETDEPNREQVAEHEPERRRDCGDAQRLPEDRAQDFRARHSECAQDSERLRALQDRECHGPVDQEHADDERQQSEGSEIRSKCSCQLFERVELVFDGDQHRACRRSGRERAGLRLGQR